jgi:hypothetical protein
VAGAAAVATAARRTAAGAAVAGRAGALTGRTCRCPVTAGAVSPTVGKMCPCRVMAGDRLCSSCEGREEENQLWVCGAVLLLCCACHTHALCSLLGGSMGGCRPHQQHGCNMHV